MELKIQSERAREGASQCEIEARHGVRERNRVRATAGATEVFFLPVFVQKESRAMSKKEGEEMSKLFMNMVDDEPGPLRHWEAHIVKERERTPYATPRLSAFSGKSAIVVWLGSCRSVVVSQQIGNAIALAFGTGR